MAQPGRVELDPDLMVAGRIEPQLGQFPTLMRRAHDGGQAARLRRPDDYVVRITRPITEPLRSLVVACAMSLEVVVRPTPLGY